MFVPEYEGGSDLGMSGYLFIIKRLQMVQCVISKANFPKPGSICREKKHHRKGSHENPARTGLTNKFGH
jgi:hypothetical protein